MFSFFFSFVISKPWNSMVYCYYLGLLYNGFPLQSFAFTALWRDKLNQHISPSLYCQYISIFSIVFTTYKFCSNIAANIVNKSRTVRFLRKNVKLPCLWGFCIRVFPFFLVHVTPRHPVRQLELRAVRREPITEKVRKNHSEKNYYRSAHVDAEIIEHLSLCCVVGQDTQCLSSARCKINEYRYHK